MLDRASDERPPSGLVARLSAAAGLDSGPAARPPAFGRLLVACLASIAVSLAADAAIVRVTNAWFPATTGFAHFRPSDYGTLTVIGVVTAAGGWELVAWASRRARWLFLRAAVVVTFVLWIPDVYLFAKGEPARSVAALMVMHLVIAIVTYNLLVRVAPLRQRESAEAPSGASFGLGRTAVSSPIATTKWAWVTLIGAVSLEFALGLFCLLAVPYSRPSEWAPHQGRLVYLAHGLLGGLLFLAALAMAAAARPAARKVKLAALIGLSGVVLGAAGGFLSVDHPLRLLGGALMFVGSAGAFFGYLVPLVEEAPATGGA